VHSKTKRFYPFNNNVKIYEIKEVCIDANISWGRRSRDRMVV